MNFANGCNLKISFHYSGSHKSFSNILHIENAKYISLTSNFENIALFFSTVSVDCSETLYIRITTFISLMIRYILKIWFCNIIILKNAAFLENVATLIWKIILKLVGLEKLTKSQQNEILKSNKKYGHCHRM